MPYFSRASMKKLDTCELDLIRLFNEVVRHWDCAVICGHRSETAQEEAFRTGRSKLRYPYSKHNSYPSMAVDVAPWSSAVPHIDWEDIELFRAFGGFVLGTAKQMGIDIRWGGDWDGDHNFRDQRLIDMPHYELWVPGA